MSRLVRLGTRGSALALAQAKIVEDWLGSHFADVVVDTVIIKTTGDRFVDRPLSALGGKGVFVNEIEDALLEQRIDCAVHSMKDLPSDLAAGLIIAAVPKREAAHDVFVSRDGSSLRGIKVGARIGTSSLRRMALLRASRPDLEVIPLRGNVDTRLRKLENQELDGIVLAAAGLNRLGVEHPGAVPLALDEFLPAIGQGALAIETRADSIASLFADYNDPTTADAVRAERSFLRRVGGSCRTPLAAHATLQGTRLTLTALISAIDGSRIVRGERIGSASDAEGLGYDLADDVLGRGGRAILDAFSESDAG